MFLAILLLIVFLFLRVLLALYKARDLDLKKFAVTSKFTAVKAYSALNLFRIKKDSETAFVIVFRPSLVLSSAIRRFKRN